MKPIGACRTCLVQIDGTRGFPASCSVPARDGMVVRTDTPEVRRIRGGVLELTLGMVSGPVISSPLAGEDEGEGYHPHPNLPPSRGKGADGLPDLGQLTIAAQHHGIDQPRWQSRQREQTDESNPESRACHQRLRDLHLPTVQGPGHETHRGLPYLPSADRWHARLYGSFRSF